MHIPLVDLKAQYHAHREQIDDAISSVIDESAFIGGEYVKLFEEQFAEFLGINNFVGCANGTDAIEIALRVLGIGRGDEVIVPAHTWISTSEAVTSVGATIVFADTLADTYTIDPVSVEGRITSRTKAIIPVHLYGCPCDMDSICSLAGKFDIKVIEDSAQAHGAIYRGKKVGTIGDAGTFSFYPGKNLGAYGDAGGMVFKREENAARARMMADHGRVGKHNHVIEGRNSRLDGLQAAILSAKLPNLEAWTLKRERVAARYAELLAPLELKLQKSPPESRHVHHIYAIQIEDRDATQNRMAARGIETGIHYPSALPFIKPYAHLNHIPKDFPVAHRVTSKVLSLPMYPELSDEQLHYIVNQLTEVMGLK